MKLFAGIVVVLMLSVVAWTFLYPPLEIYHGGNGSSLKSLPRKWFQESDVMMKRSPVRVDGAKQVGVVVSCLLVMACAVALATYEARIEKLANPTPVMVIAFIALGIPFIYLLAEIGTFLAG